MKTIRLPILLLGIALLALTGCGKSDKNQPPSVVVDLAKLDTAFASGSAEQRGAIEQMRQSLRYGMHVRVLEQVDKLGQSPSLTADQKKALAEITEQLKQMIAKSATPAK